MKQSNLEKALRSRSDEYVKETGLDEEEDMGMEEDGEEEKDELSAMVDGIKSCKDPEKKNKMIAEAISTLESMKA